MAGENHMSPEWIHVRRDLSRLLQGSMSPEGPRYKLALSNRLWWVLTRKGILSTKMPNGLDAA